MVLDYFVKELTFMRIAIVDDIAEERRLLHDKLEKALNRHCVHADIFEYESGEDYLSAARHQLFTVSFLDIYMNGITGIDAADELRTFDRTGLLIFTTASTDHALEGFRVRAMHYLVKPYNEKDIEALVSEILSRIPKPDKCLDIKVNGIGICLRFRDIAYAEHFCHMIHIHTANQKELATRQSFREFTAPLREDERFFLCSRGSIVNMEHVADFDKSTFVMNNGENVAVSRDLIKSARQTFMNFLFQRGNQL